MFFVFGPNGQVVRGPARQLSPIGAVRKIGRAQALRTRSGDGESGEMPQAAYNPAPPAQPAITALNRDNDPLRAQGAVNAYLSTEKGPRQARQPLQFVADVMSRNPITVTPEMVVNNAWQHLAEQGVAQAPVVNTQGRVVGMLLRADMAPLDLLPEPGAVRDAIALARRPVAEVMLSPIPAVSPDTELRRLATVLLDTQLPGLPVSDESGALIGFVSRTDILRAVAADPPLDLWS